MPDSFGTCPACNKKFRNKPAVAGKSVKCPCGKGSIKFPLMDEPPKPASSADDLDFAEPAPPKKPVEKPAVSACPNCKTPMPAGAILCMNCGYNTKTGTTFKTEIE